MTEKQSILGRIAQLTRRVLIAAGYDDLHVHDPTRHDPLPDHHFDFAVETMASTEAIATLVRAVRPGATIILKSRQHAPVAIHLPTLIRKELTLRAGAAWDQTPTQDSNLAAGEFGRTTRVP